MPSEKAQGGFFTTVGVVNGPYKVKGVPKRAEVVQRTPDFVEFLFQKPLREREAVRRNLVPNVWLEMTKKASFIDDKREWENNLSFPIKLTQNA